MSEWVISSSVLIILMIGLRFVLRGKLSLRLQYGLWLVVLIRLLMPVSPAESSFSVAGLLQSERLQGVANIYLWYGEGDTDADRENGALPDGAGDGEAAGEQSGGPDGNPDGEQSDGVAGEQSGQLDGGNAAGKAGKISLGMILTVIWCVGMAVTAAVLLVSNLRFASTLRKSRKVYGVENSPVPVYCSDAVATPCLFGLFRPAVYLTTEATENDTIIHHVLAHETTHYVHRDHIWAALRCLCLTLHWYNPLVWWAAALSRRDAELACDEGAIERIGEAVRGEYGRTLIGLTCQGRGFLLSTATTMTGSAKGIRERIMLIANRPKMAWYTVIILIVLIVAMVGCTYFGAEGPEESGENPYLEMEKPYEYPVLPGTEEWLALGTTQARVAACQIPEDVLKELTAEELLRVVLDYPFLGDILAYSSLYQGYTAVCDRFNGLRELTEREGLAEVLAEFDVQLYIESLGEETDFIIEEAYRCIVRYNTDDDGEIGETAAEELRETVYGEVGENTGQTIIPVRGEFIVGRTNRTDHAVTAISSREELENYFSSLGIALPEELTGRYNAKWFDSHILLYMGVACNGCDRSVVSEISVEDNSLVLLVDLICQKWEELSAVERESLAAEVKDNPGAGFVHQLNTKVTEMFLEIDRKYSQNIESLETCIFRMRYVPFEQIYEGTVEYKTSPN